MSANLRLIDYLLDEIQELKTHLSKSQSGDIDLLDSSSAGLQDTIINAYKGKISAPEYKNEVLQGAAEVMKKNARDSLIQSGFINPETSEHEPLYLFPIPEDALKHIYRGTIIDFDIKITGGHRHVSCVVKDIIDENVYISPLYECTHEQ